MSIWLGTKTFVNIDPTHIIPKDNVVFIRINNFSKMPVFPLRLTVIAGHRRSTSKFIRLKGFKILLVCPNIEFKRIKRLAGSYMHASWSINVKV